MFVIVFVFLRNIKTTLIFVLCYYYLLEITLYLLLLLLKSLDIQALKQMSPEDPRYKGYYKINNNNKNNNKNNIK